MPIVERDPWRLQYFAGVDCPEEVVVPTEDSDAWQLYPAHRWVYNKLLICETQGLEHAPHGVPPRRYPVFSKPIYNLRGMGTGSQVLQSAAEYARHQAPGHMWMELARGEHVSTDVAVIAGEAQWWRHTIGVPLAGGRFDHWTVLAERRPPLERSAGAWLRRLLAGYTGMVNLETIGGTIIECHLRLADQWVDLNGSGWLEAVVELYARGRFSFADEDRRTGYSVVLFGEHGRPHGAVEPPVVAELLRDPAISSIQITFDDSKPPEHHPMPPGGFRLAIVNCWDLAAGLAARRVLAKSLGGL